MRTDAQTIEARKAADKAQYQQEWTATTPAGPSAEELVELCNIHGDKMWNEGWYTSARALYLAAEEIERLRVALALILCGGPEVARTMAAAPDLLAALQALKSLPIDIEMALGGTAGDERSARMDGLQSIFEQVNEAIAKATQPAASRGEATPNSTAELGA